LSARLLAAVIAVGIAWAGIAAAVHLALFRGLIPSYDEVALPVAIGLALVDLPVLVGLYVETAIGRGSITFAEVIAASVISGVLLSLALAALVLRIRGALAAAR
jgi:hypothetical protein